jgi:hypothetical protein
MLSLAFASVRSAAGSGVGRPEIRGLSDPEAFPTLAAAWRRRNPREEAKWLVSRIATRKSCRLTSPP